MKKRKEFLSEGRLLGRLREDRSGSIAVTTALLTPVFVAGLAIVIDVAWFRYRQAVLQNAADMVALSLTTDLSQNMWAASLPVITANARNEARKYGCVKSCTVSVAWPYAGNPQSVQVTVTDPSVTRLFSAIYSRENRSLTAVSGARSSNQGLGTGVPGSDNAGSACVLALGNNPTSEGAPTIEITRPFMAQPVSGCEWISNGSGSNSITLEGSGVDFTNRLSSVGGIQVSRGATARSQNPNMAMPIPDPYGPTYMAPGSPLRFDQFRMPQGTTSGFRQSECIERVDPVTGSPVVIDWTRRQTVADIPSLVERGYTYSEMIHPWRVAILDIQIHAINGGGGRWCNLINLHHIHSRIVLGPGIWFFDKGVTGLGTIMAPQGSPVPVNPMIPRAAGHMINGNTLILPSMPNDYLLSRFQIIAPTQGPMPGAAMVHDVNTERPGNRGHPTPQIHFSWFGTVWLPRSDAWGWGGFETNMFCSHLVVNRFIAHHEFQLRNLCRGVPGMVPFGTETSGWNTVPNPGTRSRLMN